MIIAFSVVISYLCFVEIIESKLMRFQPQDEIFSYTIDSSVKPFTEYATIENFILEQIDDDNVEASGYTLFLKSLNPKLPVSFDARTKFFENSVWVDLPFRITLPNICSEFLEPSRFWYNITKLWSTCPPQKGDKWVVERQMISFKMQFPPSTPSGSWQILITGFQIGTLHKVGITYQVDVIDIN